KTSVPPVCCSGPAPFEPHPASASEIVSPVTIVSFAFMYPPMSAEAFYAELRRCLGVGSTGARDSRKPEEVWRLREIRDRVAIGPVVALVEEADVAVLGEHELAVARVRLVVEQLQYVVVILDPPAVAAAHVLDGQVVLVVVAAVLVRNGRCAARGVAPIVEDVFAVLLTRVGAAEEAVPLVPLRERNTLRPNIFARAAVQAQHDVRTIADLVNARLVMRGDAAGVVTDAVFRRGPRGWRRCDRHLGGGHRRRGRGEHGARHGRRPGLIGLRAACREQN